MSCLSDRSYCQLRAALLLTQIFVNHSLVQPTTESSSGEEIQASHTSGHAGRTAGAKFEITDAILKCLSEQDKVKPIYLQMVYTKSMYIAANATMCYVYVVLLQAFRIIEMISLQLDSFKVNILETMVEVIG